jgi:hypothetical protein
VLPSPVGACAINEAEWCVYIRVMYTEDRHARTERKEREREREAKPQTSL